jgi:hypothetical protein
MKIKRRKAMQRRRFVIGSSLAMLLLAPMVQADLLSKSYEFEEGVMLEVGAENQDGLRLDTVRVQLPSTNGGRFLRTGGLVRAEITVSNNSETSQKIGLAMALFDAQGRLLAVASGGTKLLPIKPDRQKTYNLVFDYVNAEAFRANRFQISLESKP